MDGEEQPTFRNGIDRGSDALKTLWGTSDLHRENGNFSYDPDGEFLPQYGVDNYISPENRADGPIPE